MQLPVSSCGPRLVLHNTLAILVKQPVVAVISNPISNSTFSQHTLHTFVETTPAAAAKPEMMMDPTTPANVPSRLTAPSVPAATGLNVVIRNVRLPYAYRPYHRNEMTAGQTNDGYQQQRDTHNVFVVRGERYCSGFWMWGKRSGVVV